jgi:hypothetical protein
MISLVGRRRSATLVAAAASGLLLSLFSVILPARELRAQTVYLSGHVVSAESGERLGGASMGILGTTRGVRANREGLYRIALDRGVPYRLRVTLYGYRPDTLSVRLSSDSTCDIRLQTTVIDAGSVTVTADRSRFEGRRIMHRVIDSKDSWQQAIRNYTFDVYSRLNIRTGSDTTSKVLAILESFAKGYWDRAKGYAERITGRKQTANLPIDVNQIALFDLENFYNDRLEVDQYTVVGPAAHDAFDRYDYDLIGTGELNGSAVYKISVEPLNSLFPAFQGTLLIDQMDYTIVYLDLAPNDAIKLGPIHNAHVTQTFAFVDNKYWLPNQLSLKAEIRFDLPIAPRFSIEQDGVLNDYVVNGSIPDSIFQHVHGLAGNADSVDSLDWTALRPIPLAKDEQHAYVRIDSMVKLPPAKPSFSLTSLLFELLTQPDIYQFNRVEGSRVQFTTGLHDIAGWPLSLGGTVGYSIDQNKWKYVLRAEQGLSWTERTVVSGSLGSNGDVNLSAHGKQKEVTTSVGASYFNETIRRGDAYSPLVNTATALLLHEDYPNYYSARGFSAWLQYLAGRERLVEQIYFKQEDTRSDTNITNYSLLLRQHHYRENPAVEEGIWRYAGFELNGSLPIEGWSVHGSLHGEWGWSDRAQPDDGFYMLGGASLTTRTRLGGWGDLSVFGKLDATPTGSLPAQRKLFVETHDGPIRASTAFNTLRPFEFESNTLFQGSIEQNFYDLPTRLVGVTLPFTLNWIGFANYALFDDVTRYTGPVAGIGYGGTTRAEVLEAGVALGGILNVLRVDAAWRLTQDKPFVVTGTLQFSF